MKSSKPIRRSSCINCLRGVVAAADQDGDALRDLFRKNEVAQGRDREVSSVAEFAVRAIEEDPEGMAEIFPAVRAEIDTMENAAHLYLHEVPQRWTQAGEFDKAEALIEEGHGLDPDEGLRSEGAVHCVA